ncbi:hypothetical protein GGF32_003179 [Allomyces javanicus]|nr:hypothetical protein GGF32_003179 [Allomyces javanicus]
MSDSNFDDSYSYGNNNKSRGHGEPSDDELEPGDTLHSAKRKKLKAQGPVQPFERPGGALGALGDLLAGDGSKHDVPLSFGGLAAQLPADPALVIDGVGHITLPIVDDSVATKIIAVARDAPFGRGYDTLVGPAVRKTWQIEPDRVHFEKPDWDSVDFVTHRDTEKHDRMSIERQLHRNRFRRDPQNPPVRAASWNPIAQLAVDSLLSPAMLVLSSRVALAPRLFRIAAYASVPENLQRLVTSDLFPPLLTRKDVESTLTNLIRSLWCPANRVYHVGYNLFSKIQTATHLIDKHVQLYLTDAVSDEQRSDARVPRYPPIQTFLQSGEKSMSFTMNGPAAAAADAWSQVIDAKKYHVKIGVAALQQGQGEQYQLTLTRFKPKKFHSGDPSLIWRQEYRVKH